MPRKNASNVVENAEFNIDLEKFGKNLEEIHPPKKVWCDDCGKRLSWCECKKEEENGLPTDNTK